MKGFSFFKRQHSNGTPISSWTLAAYHHPHSITWRWAIWYSRKAGKARLYFHRVYKHQGFNFQAGISLPALGTLSIHTQPHMWERT